MIQIYIGSRTKNPTPSVVRNPTPSPHKSSDSDSGSDSATLEQVLRLPSLKHTTVDYNPDNDLILEYETD